MIKKILIGVVILLILIAGIRFTLKRMDKQDDLPPPTLQPKLPINEDDLSVFPGAEGFGTTTVAGRGGKIIEVTTLADKGPGSLREALETEGPRIIVFRVGGVIDVTSDNLFIRYPFVTVAGQTAPGDGITIIGMGVTIITHDVLLQHLRIRPGDKGNANPETNDAIEIFDQRWVEAKSEQDLKGLKRDKIYNIVLDHISASWTGDEMISVYKGTRDVTISNSILSEALNEAGHPKKTHSAGLMLGDFTDRVSIHHNILAHNDFRNPLIKNSGLIDFRNNIVYDWGIEAKLIENSIIGNLDIPKTRVNIMGNNYIRGSSTLESTKPIRLSQEILVKDLLYVNGNVLPQTGETDDDFIPFFTFDIDQKNVEGETLEEKILWGKETFFVTEPFDTPAVTTLSAGKAYNKVLTEAGALKPKRDHIDIRIVNEVKTETGRIIDSVDDVGGYPAFQLSTWPEDYDSDHDGMSDEWESSQGLNPNDNSDANKDADQDGYTNIEEFLHELLI